MSDKEPTVDALTSIDHFPPMEEGARKAELLAGIEEALAQVERGETYTVDEVRKMIKEWARQ